MIWHAIRYLITFILPSFYKRIQGKNVMNLQVKGPVIIAMNHPNAFTDPVAFSYVSYPLRLKYLARGDAFKPGIVSYFLEQIGIVPIFRIQDAGKEGLKKNDEAYKRVNQLLKKNEKIIVFAEGLCVQERRLRPLKKGVSRMVFGAYEYLQNDELIVVPVGVNYSQPDKFRSTLFYNVGEPIAVKDYINLYKDNPAKANNLFLHDLEPKMKDLITHINNKEYDGVVLQLETLCKKDLIRQQGLNPRKLEDDYSVTKQLTEKVNAAEIKNKPILDEFKTKSNAYFRELRENKLRDWIINPEQNKSVNSLNIFLRSVLILLALPLFIIGLAGNYIPYKGTGKLTRKILKRNTEFYSSICIGIGMFFFWIYYVIAFISVYHFSTIIFWPLLVCLAFALCGWFNLYFYFYVQKTCGMLRAVKNKALIERLLLKRTELMSLINKF